MITADNCKEFVDLESIAKERSTDFYFTHPYSSWERTTNENMNGLIRKCFPKKSNFVTITDTETEFITDRLNNRPRQYLGFISPNQYSSTIHPLLHSVVESMLMYLNSQDLKSSIILWVKLGKFKVVIRSKRISMIIDNIEFAFEYVSTKNIPI